VQGRHAVFPRERLLEPGGQCDQEVLLDGSGADLHADRQPVAVLGERQRDGRLAK
jgi:hypothetical protein